VLVGLLAAEVIAVLVTVELVARGRMGRAAPGAGRSPARRWWRRALR